MNYTFPKLLVWVEQSLSPAALMSRELTSEDFQSRITYSKNKSAKWKINISSYMLGQANPNAKREYLKAQQQQLVMMTNQTNQYLFKEKRIWVFSAHAAQIKQLYTSVLNTFEELLNYAEKHFTEFYDPTVRISDFRLQKILPGLRKSTSELSILLREASIEPELNDLIVKSIRAISIPGKLSYASLTYVNKLITVIKRLDDLDQQKLVYALISLDFNRPEFYLYLMNAMNLRLQYIDGLHEQLESVIQQSSDLNDTRIQSEYRFNADEPSLKNELHCFYEAKIAYLEKMLKHRRRAIQDKEDVEKSLRILLDMTVPQFALFVRVLKETQIILKTGITEVCTFFAMHFYTDKAFFISSTNLLKRSTDVEFTTVLKLWDMLIAMQDWLDAKFSVRSYRRSLK